MDAFGFGIESKMEKDGTIADRDQTHAKAVELLRSCERGFIVMAVTDKTQVEVLACYTPEEIPAFLFALQTQGETVYGSAVQVAREILRELYGEEEPPDAA